MSAEPVVPNSSMQPSAALDLGEGLSCLAYQPSRRLAAVSTVKTQTFLVSVKEGGPPGTPCATGMRLLRVGAFGAVRPERLAWQCGQATSLLAAADRTGGIHLFDVAAPEKSLTSRFVGTKVNYYLGHNRVACSLAWNPHIPDVVAFSTKDHILITWDTRIPHTMAAASSAAGPAPPPATVGPSPARYSFTGQGNDISYSPHHPHLVAVASQIGSTGSLLLFDQRNLAVSLATVNTPGPCTAVDFHPRYSDLLVYGYKSYIGHSKRDATVAFLQLQVDSVRAPSVHTPWCSDERPWLSWQSQPQLPEITTFSTMAKLRWREVPSQSKLSPLWFASFPSSMDSNTYVWDGFHPYAPVITFTNLHPPEPRAGSISDARQKGSSAPCAAAGPYTDKPSDRCISDFAWVSPSAFLTCSKNSRVLVCTSLGGDSSAGPVSLQQRRLEAPPTISATLGCLGTVVAVRDQPELRVMYEADVASTQQAGDSLSEKSALVGAAAVQNSPPPAAPPTPCAGAPSQLSQKVVKNPLAPPAPPPPKEKERSIFDRLFKKDDKEKSAQKAANVASSTPPSQLSTAAPAAAHQQTPQPLSSNVSDSASVNSPSISRPSVTSGHHAVTDTVSSMVMPPSLAPSTDVTSGGAGGGFQAASIADLPAANFAHEYPTLSRLRPSKPKAVLESLSLWTSKLACANHAASTSRRTFRTLAQKWECWYEYCVTIRQIQSIDADDVFVNRDASTPEATDEAFAQVCERNADVCTQIAKLDEEDPRVCIWSALAAVFTTNHEALIVQHVMSSLMFAAQCGDTQLATFVYITGVLWWRHRVTASSERLAADQCPLLANEWKERSFDWVEHYAALLEASQLYVEWNELALVYPYAIRTSGPKPECFANPVFNVAMIAHEKAIEFVHCGSCGGVVSPQDLSVTASHATGGGGAASRPGSNGGVGCLRAVQAVCSRCRPKPLHVCIICEQIVEGSFLWMKPCGHGGHPEHISAWLEENDNCPRCGAWLKTATQ